MSRSTPLNNLPNKSSESLNAYDTKENELVKEILQEIDTEKHPQGNQQQEMARQQQQQQQQQEMAMQQEMARQHEMAQEQQELSKHMAEQQDMHEQMLDNQKKEPVLSSKSMSDKVLEMAKLPLVVGVIAILVSIPAFTTMLEGMVKSKASLASYANIIILLVKGLVAGGLYFGINKSL
jgi:hypothetical protein